MISITVQNIEIDDGIGFIDAGENIVSLIIEGHALFNKKGNDIVCGAVSTLSQTLIKAISAIARINQNWEQRDGYLSSSIDIKDLDEEKKNSQNTAEFLFYRNI